MRKSQKTVTVLSNLPAGPDQFSLRFKCKELAESAVPGQFLMVKVSDTLSPLLRRPFGIHRVTRDEVAILYERVGKGTELLSKKRRGEKLDVIAPLGNGFDLTPGAGRCRVLVAGGMGVAPLLFLAQELRKIPPARRKNLVLIGGRTEDAVLCVKNFRSLGFEVRVATDDGTQGFHGYVTGLLEQALADPRYAGCEVYGCGPRPMLKEIFRIAKLNGIHAQVSLEEHMSCGIGACQGCVVNTVAGYKRVCQDGPVFDSNEIIW